MTADASPLRLLPFVAVVEFWNIRGAVTLGRILVWWCRPGVVGGSRLMKLAAGRAALNKADTVIMHESPLCFTLLALNCRNCFGGKARHNFRNGRLINTGWHTASEPGNWHSKAAANSAPRIGTPVAFRDILLQIAKTAGPVFRNHRS